MLAKTGTVELKLYIFMISLNSNTDIFSVWFGC